MKNLKLYSIENKYIDYLRRFDDKVPYNKNGNRPFVGVVYEYNNHYYFAPLSSPKSKHLKMSNKRPDIFKIDNGELGIVNINNMLPVPIECLQLLLPTITDKKYKILLEKQLTFLNNNKHKLFKKVNQYYNRYKNGFLTEVQKQITCNFDILELKCDEYKFDNQNSI